MSILHRSFASYLVITVKWPKITFCGSKMVPKVANCFLLGRGVLGLQISDSGRKLDGEPVYPILPTGNLI